MGPTFFLSSTHTKAAHEAFNEGNLRKTTLLRATPRRLGLLKQAITQRPLLRSDPPLVGRSSFGFSGRETAREGSAYARGMP
eukprot:5348752-Pleurochrysis_carterae.AAC.2